MSSELVKLQLTSMKRSAECRACHRALRPDSLVRCTSGHAVCTPCRSKISSCSVCRSPFAPDSEKTLVLCQLLECLPQLCKDVGCSTLLERVDNHGTQCGLRLLKCEMQNCSLDVVAQDFMTSLSEKNTLNAIKQETVDFHFKNMSDFKRSLQTVSVVSKTVEGQDFLIHYEYVEDRKMVTVKVYLVVKNRSLVYYLSENYIDATLLISHGKTIMGIISQQPIPLKKLFFTEMSKNVFFTGLGLEIPDPAFDKFSKYTSFSLTTTIHIQ